MVGGSGRVYFRRGAAAACDTQPFALCHGDTEQPDGWRRSSLMALYSHAFGDAGRAMMRCFGTMRLSPKPIRPPMSHALPRSAGLPTNQRAYSLLSNTITSQEGLCVVALDEWASAAGFRHGGTGTHFSEEHSARDTEDKDHSVVTHFL